jgi:hypothetical protein
VSVLGNAATEKFSRLSESLPSLECKGWLFFTIEYASEVVRTSPTGLDVRLNTISLLLLLCCTAVQAQQIFYDSKRDKQASDAATAAKEVTSGSVFDKMQRNAERQAAIELKTGQQWQSVLGPAAVDGIEQWNSKDDVLAAPKPSAHASVCMQKSVWGVPDLTTCRSLRCRLEALRNQLNNDEALDKDEAAIEKRVARIKEITVELKAEIAKIQAADAMVKDKLLKPLLNQLEDGEALLGLAEKLNKATGSKLLGRAKALGEIEGALSEIKQWTTTIQNIWVSYQMIRQSPRNLLPLHQQLDLDLVMIEQERIKRQGFIHARLHLDTADVKRKLDQAVRLFCGRDTVVSACALLQSEATIEDSLRNIAAAYREAERNKNESEMAAQQRRMLNIVTGLHEAVSAFTQGASGLTLCGLREGAANRAAEIQRAAAGAKATEKATVEATQRLALYYKSGITKSQLASLAFSILGGVAAPVAAVK